MFVLTAHFQRERDILQNRAVRQQAERLEHHAHLGAAHIDQFFFIEGHDVLTIDLNRAACDFMQAGKTTDQCGLA